ncbi:PREDICTED: protein dispatched-like [Ceratosolen solmsi marchali]|uniref:Protein dispatched-like n=1 Tax=Ceratosolen solmsi marchali TaxID=326594 RepID=A0AAJ7DTJ2_9HYME|nr:PREDICTED: protein dispatched-like [Ceratosolen solmsi marchali]
MQDQLSTAPHGMKNGWFVSDLEFYELQRTLYEGTIWSIIVSMILTLFILAFVTLNPIISLFAILSVGITIAIAVAGLIFIGWKLNVLENITISTAIGLAVDFNLHYGVSYRINTANNRLERVKIALEQMSGPTLMAALTTSVAGALMLPSQVLPYIQIGIFLVLIMGVSWICATFFFCPLLSIGGPSKFLQFDSLRFNTSLLHSKKNKKLTTIVNESIELPIKQKKSTEISIAETRNNTNKEFQFHRDSSLPTFTRSIIHNAEIHYTISNGERPDLDS